MPALVVDRRIFDPHRLNHRRRRTARPVRLSDTHFHFHDGIIAPVKEIIVPLILPALPHDMLQNSDNRAIYMLMVYLELESARNITPICSEASSIHLLLASIVRIYNSYLLLKCSQQVAPVHYGASKLSSGIYSMYTAICELLPGYKNEQELSSVTVVAVAVATTFVYSIA